jgi:putative endonuclease
MKMEYYTYILYSETTIKHYCGITDDIDKRLKEHNSGKCSSTKSGAPWKVVFQEKFTTRKDARLLEVKIKNRGPKRFLTESGRGSASGGINSVG